MKDFVILDDLLAELEKCHTQKDLDKFIKKHRDVQMIGDLIINAAEDKIKDGEYDTGILYILSAYESKYLNVYDDVTIYLRLAEYYIENGEYKTFELPAKKYIDYKTLQQEAWKTPEDREVEKEMKQLGFSYVKDVKEGDNF